MAYSPTKGRTQRSECPKSFVGAITSLTLCLISLGSGKRPSFFLSHKTCPLIQIKYLPATSDGLSCKACTSSVKVVSSSCAIQAARNSQPHLGQYSISTVGFIASDLIHCKNHQRKKQIKKSRGGHPPRLSIIT